MLMKTHNALAVGFFTGAGTYVNFFNTNDFALDKWTIDQNLKPDLGYSYSSIPNADANRFFRGSALPVPISFPTNTYEIFAYCDEARCFALGAQQNVGGSFATASQVELDAAPYGFGRQHLYHSFQFRLDNAQTSPVWTELLVQTGLKE